MNFFPENYNPNDSSTFNVVTNRNEFGAILGNILWLLEKHNNDKYLLFSAEPRRMKLYSNAFDNFKDKFYVFPPKKYDPAYEHDMVILIRK